ncbi:hypothetical protein [Aquabacterium sp.]|uniref:hypothetical protein n=1 Tax=Aquabacterium sp. TaxID=1872578 RepID=UPI0035B1BECA
MHHALSPLTQSGIRATAEGWLTRQEGDNARIRPVYLCPACDERHTERSDAAGCCALNIESVYLCPVCSELHYSEPEARECCAAGGDSMRFICPVCSTEHKDTHEAADCCLWKDTTPHQRFLIASRLEADPRITWQEAIEYAMSQPQPT